MLTSIEWIDVFGFLGGSGRNQEKLNKSNGLLSHLDRDALGWVVSGLGLYHIRIRKIVKNVNQINGLLIHGDKALDHCRLAQLGRDLAG